ncbi:hypothetical protein [Roseovarius sp. EL26]|uniref:hypothetical protein n=1 Tax=Roseovarius sp. EL26 TaxID=2126672 RepID=UPI00349F0A73
MDYLIGFGPMLVGHNHPEVMEVIQAQLSDGMTFFTNNSVGIELAVLEQSRFNAAPSACLRHL